MHVCLGMFSLKVNTFLPVQCIRVVGAIDEGPSHSEVRFLYTTKLNDMQPLVQPGIQVFRWKLPK